MCEVTRPALSSWKDAPLSNTTSIRNAAQALADRMPKGQALNHFHAAREVKALREALSTSAEESLGVQSHRCPMYWSSHESRCVLDRRHKGDCYYLAPARAISLDVNFTMPPKEPRGAPREPVPFGWYRGVSSPGGPWGPPEYDYEAYVGDDPPTPEAGWQPLYKEAEVGLANAREWHRLCEAIATILEVDSNADRDTMGKQIAEAIQQLRSDLETQTRLATQRNRAIGEMGEEIESLRTAATAACSEMGCFCPGDHESTPPEKRSALCKLGDLIDKRT